MNASATAALHDSSRRRKDAAGGPAVLACWGSRKKADREAEVEARRRPQCRMEARDRRTLLYNSAKHGLSSIANASV